MGQYGTIQILHSAFPEYYANLICSVYSNNFLRVHDAAGENKIIRKIQETRRNQDTRALAPFFLLAQRGQI